MRYYPLLLDLCQTRVLIAGAGEVGCRKAADILACSPAELLWLDPAIAVTELPDGLQAHPALVYEQREAAARDIAGRGLVFAATSSRQANQALAQACAAQGTPCNVIDAPQEGNFIVPSHFTDGSFMLALSTGGASPAMAKLMRRELQEWYSGRYRALMALMGRLRPLVLGLDKPTGENTALFRAVATSTLGEVLGREDTDEARRLLERLLPPELHGKIEDLLHGLY